MSVSIEKVELPAGATELIIREGVAAPIAKRTGMNISGTIEAPYEYYRKRNPLPADAVLFVRLSEAKLTLECDATTEQKTTVTGKIEIDPEYTTLISTDWEVERLAKYLRSKRHYFESSESWIAVLKLFQKFTANVEKSISGEKSQGVFRSNVEALVNSSLPKTLTLNVPVIKGKEASQVNFEVFVDVTENHKVIVKLEAPEMDATVKEMTASVLVEQVEKFKDEIVIIYQ